MFKSLLPSLSLVIIYFIAEEFFGPKVGLAAAIALGGGELIYYRIRYKHIDWPTVWGTLLFVGLGIIILLFEGTPVERLQPVIIEGIMCLLLGIYAFSRADITKSLPESYRQNIHLSPEQQQGMRRMIRLLFYLLTAHTAVAVVAAFFFSEEQFAFISGPLLYILIGLFFLTLFVKNRLLAWAARHDEWLPIVNEKGEVTGKATRRSCHSGSKLLHPVIHLHLLNAQGDIFLQKRSLKKKLLPGRWDAAVGGHVNLGETIENALKRETQEELGITHFKARFLGNYIWESAKERELVFSFASNSHDTITINPEEVDEGRFWTRQEIEDPASASLLTPNFLHEYARLLKNRKL